MTSYYPYPDEQRDAFERAELLFGHTDEASAYVVDDYPYGFKLRTQIRYWIETNAKHGDRFVSQTLNPKTGAWNKPKRDTYSPVTVLRLDDAGHVKTTGLGLWPHPDRIAHFMERCGDQLNEYQRKQVASLIGYNKAFEGVTFECVNTTGWSAEQHAEFDAKQKVAEQAIGRRVAVETFHAKNDIVREFGFAADAKEATR